MCRGKALDLAEDGGYILVAPMGYEVGGWYGSPVIPGRGRAGQPPPPPPPANLAELSEKDVFNVLAMIKKEFNVDENRTYLMGHSMGGAGALFLGSKHASEWAAIAAMAPAAFRMNDNRAAILRKIKDAGVPVIVTQGDADTLVPVTNTRLWVDTMKELKLDYEVQGDRWRRPRQCHRTRHAGHLCVLQGSHEEDEINTMGGAMPRGADR